MNNATISIGMTLLAAWSSLCGKWRLRSCTKITIKEAMRRAACRQASLKAVLMLRLIIRRCLRLACTAIYRNSEWSLLIMVVHTWIEPMVVINSQPWGIVYWLAFKRLPVQTTYLFLQAFLKYFYSQEMLTTSEIKFKLHLILTLSVQLETIMTFYEENYGQNELNL